MKRLGVRPRQSALVSVAKLRRCADGVCAVAMVLAVVRLVVSEMEAIATASIQTRLSHIAGKSPSFFVKHGPR